MNTAMITGSTGLIGSGLTKLLIQSDLYDKVEIITRRSTGIKEGKGNEHLVNFDDPGSFPTDIKADDAFCCLGTTIKSAGTKPKFYKVDFQYVADFAEYAHNHGAKRFFLVSSMGANPGSAFFYNKVKGEIEERVSSLPFEGVVIFRPSLLLGKRTEKRSGEAIAQSVFKLINPVVPKKYRGIKGLTVAEAMVASAGMDLTGVHIILSDKIFELADKKK